MKHLAIIILFSITTNLQSNAQSFPDADLTWVQNDSCVVTGAEVFVKVEIDPVIKQFSRAEFEAFMYNLILKLNLEEDQNGILKLKLLFAKNQNLSVRAIGYKDISLKKSQIDTLTNSLNAIHHIIQGKQRHIEVHCQGILYIHIMNGKMRTMSHVNFTFN